MANGKLAQFDCLPWSFEMVKWGYVGREGSHIIAAWLGCCFNKTAAAYVHGNLAGVYMGKDAKYPNE